jgi:hypothetical protein
MHAGSILEVAGKFGTVEAGKRANLVLASGDVLQSSTQVLSVFIDIWLVTSVRMRTSGPRQEQLPMKPSHNHELYIFVIVRINIRKLLIILV